MSRKIFFFTDTAIPPARLIEREREEGEIRAAIPEIAALDPLMAASSFEPDPEFAPSEAAVQARREAINARYEVDLNDINARIAEQYRLYDLGEINSLRLVNNTLLPERANIQSQQREELRNVIRDLTPNSFPWLRSNDDLSISTRNITRLRSPVRVHFGSVNTDGDESSYSSGEENNLYYRRTYLGGSSGYSKQSVIVQGLVQQWASAEAYDDVEGENVRGREFSAYEARAQTEIESFGKFTNLFNRTVVQTRQEKLRLGMISNLQEQSDSQYMNPYSCILVPLALQTDWVKDSKVTNDYLNRFGGIAGVTSLDAEYNYPAPAEYYKDEETYPALANQPEINGARVRTEDTYDYLPETRKRQLPRYVQVTFNRRSFGDLSKKIEEANGFSTFVPRLVEKMSSGAARDYFFKSTFQFLNEDGFVQTANETVGVKAIDLESELDGFIEALTSQDDPQPLPPNYFGSSPVVKDDLGNDAPPQQDACVSFLDRLKMAALQAEIKKVQEDFVDDLNYEKVWRYTHDVNRQASLRATRERLELDIAQGRRPASAFDQLNPLVKAADPSKVNLDIRKPEVLFYRVDQHEVDPISNEVNLEPTSKYYVRGGTTKYIYVDPRVEYGAKYKYVIYAYVITPALQYEIGKVEPVDQSGNLRLFQIAPGITGLTAHANQPGVFSTEQDPFRLNRDWQNNQDTFKQAYDQAKANRQAFLGSSAAREVRNGNANLTELNTALNIYQKNRLLLVEVPISSIVYEAGGKRGVSLPTTTIIDRPPVPPFVDIVPFKNNSQQILINFNGQTDKIFPSKDVDVNDQDNSIPYIGIEPGDTELFENIRKAQMLENFDLPEGHVEFASEGEDLESFQVFRTTDEPDARNLYAAFTGKKITDVVKVFGQAYTDTIRPNVNYYYTFRAVDKQGNVSNPTEVYKVYISEDKGQVVPSIRAFKPRRPRNQKDNKVMRKFIQVSPYILQTTAAASEEKIGTLPEKTLGSKFKLRVTSKDTGRSVDLNLTFKAAKIVNAAGTLNELERLRYGLLDTNPALVEDRLQEIRSQLVSAEVRLEDFDVQLEDRLRTIFGEGNYESFLAQFQGRPE
jgi:hypothetical protein